MRQRCRGTLTVRRVLTVERGRRCWSGGADIALVEESESFARSLSQQTDPASPKCGSRTVKRTISLIGIGKASANTTFGALCDTGSPERWAAKWLLEEEPKMELSRDKDGYLCT